VTPDAVTPLWSDNPTANDLLGFADITAPILDAVRREKLDPVTVGIFGDWGSGKTTLLELLQEDLNADERVVVLFTRPWEYDPATDPKATLIAEVLAAVHAAAAECQGGVEKLSQELRDRFKSLARRVKWSKAITLAANSVLSMGLPKIEDVMGLFGEDEETAADPTLQGFREEFAELMEQLSDIDRVVVLVDDLDRCLPDTVVATLEAVKLFLSVPKTAFVIAADRRLVTLAISARYEPSGQAALMGQQYLEKIVQIPVRVPALGRGDTEAYLALLMLQRHVEDDGVLTPLVTHCDARRRAAEPDVLKDLPLDGLPGDATGDLQLAAMLAPVLYERFEGNPRRLKRFLNAYWLRSAVATRRGITLQANAVAKLMVLEELQDAAFSTVLDWLAAGDLKDRLRTLEAETSGKVEGAAGETLEALRTWARMQPPLADLELDAYLRLAASLRSLAGPGATPLRGPLRDLAEKLLGTRAQARAARGKLDDLSLDDRLALGRHLVEVLRAQPERQGDLAETLGRLVADEAVARELAEPLAELDPAVVQPALVIWLVPDKGSTEPMRDVVGAWLASGRLDEGVQSNAERALARAREGA